MTATVLLFKPRGVEKCLAAAARWRRDADLSPTMSATKRVVTVGECLLRCDWWNRMARHVALGR